MNQVKGEGFVSLPDDHVLRKSIDWVMNSTGMWKPALGLAEMRWTVAMSRESGYSNACCHVSDHPAVLRQESSTKDDIEDSVTEVDSSSGADSEQFQMQLGWCRSREGQLRYAVFRVPDKFPHVVDRWVVTTKEGWVHLVNDCGRYALVGGGDSGFDIVEHLADCTGWDWQPVVRSATPQPGEWWQNKVSRIIVRIAALTLKGVPIWETEEGFAGASIDFSSWQHEPHCIGFDWKPGVKP